MTYAEAFDRFHDLKTLGAPLVFSQNGPKHIVTLQTPDDDYTFVSFSGSVHQPLSAMGENRVIALLSALIELQGEEAVDLPEMMFDKAYEEVYYEYKRQSVDQETD